jgi:RecA-family ATPase
MLDGVDDELVAVEWIIDEIVPEGVTVLYGDTNVGKTFLGLHMALRIAAGARCFGRATQQGTVLYIYSEGGRSLNIRKITARVKAELPAGLPIITLPATLPLGSAEANIDSFAQEVKRFCAAYGLPPVSLIIVDTVSANIRSKESETDGGQAFLQQVKILADAVNVERTASVILVHHVGHSAKGRPRGSYVFMADVDCLISVKASDVTSAGHKVTFRCQKMRDGEYFEPIAVNLREMYVPLKDGTPLLRKNGKPVTTLIVDDEVAVATVTPRIDTTDDDIRAMISAALSDRAIAKALGRTGGAFRQRVAAIRKSMEVLSNG